MRNLKGTTVLVTGGAVRIGAAVVRAFAAAGAEVIIHYRSSQQEAAALEAGIRQGGGTARTIQADLSSEEACTGLVRAALAGSGRVDVLVNSAAVFHKQRLPEARLPAILDQFWPNLFAPWLLMRELAAAQDRGRIVNLLDRRVAGHDPSCLPYVMSKKALQELTMLAALELAPRFTVNAVAPGPVLPPPGSGPEYMREHAGRVPLQVACTPESVAESVLFLACSPQLTGNVLFVDGGQHLLGNGV